MKDDNLRKTQIRSLESLLEQMGAEKGRVYVDSPEDAPEGYNAETGEQGGTYYETGGGGGEMPASSDETDSGESRDTDSGEITVTDSDGMEHTYEHTSEEEIKEELQNDVKPGRGVLVSEEYTGEEGGTRALVTDTYAEDSRSPGIKVRLLGEGRGDQVYDIGLNYVDGMARRKRTAR